MKTLTRDDLEHFGSIITLRGTDQCLGALWYADGHGTFDPAYGRVPVTEDEARQHNAALDSAMVEGLDTRCAVGQGRMFYIDGDKVTTFAGAVVSPHYRKVGKGLVEFTRGSRVFRGRIRKDSDLVFFKRVT